MQIHHRFVFIILCVVALWVGCRQKPAPEVANTPAAGAFFQVRNIDGVWWFVDPAGEKFVSLGINHIEPVLLSANSNKSIFVKRYGKDLFNPLGLPNMKGKAAQRWMDDAMERITSWGFNTLGWHNPIPQSRMPYVAVCRVANIDGWNYVNRRYRDPFDPKALAEIDSAVALWAEVKRNDPLIIGVSFNDMPVWRTKTGERHPWLDYIMGLSAEAPGKAAWVSTMKERHADLADFRAVYGVDAKDWDAVAAVADWPAAADANRAAEDEIAFLPRIADAWYGALARSLRRHDPNHLILGDKFEGTRDMPPWLDAVLRRHVDVLYIQWYDFAENQIPRLDELYRNTGKPILMGDSSFSFPTADLSSPKGVLVGSRRAVGEAYEHYLQAMMDRSYIVGWHYCGYMDSAPDMAQANPFFARQTGFLRSDGKPYREVLAKVVPANKAAFARHETATGAPESVASPETTPSSAETEADSTEDVASEASFPTDSTAAAFSNHCRTEEVRRGFLSRVDDNVFSLRIGAGKAVVPSKNISWVVTPEGVVVIDTAVPPTAKAAKTLIGETANAPVRFIIYTHHHGSNIAGTAVLMEEGTHVIAHQDLPEAFDSGRELWEYHSRINQIQFDFEQSPFLGALAEKSSPVYPDITYADRYDFNLGGTAFALHHVVGEAEDYTIIFMPEQKIVWVGDMVGLGAPMVASPMKPVRSEVQWKQGLKLIKSLEPRVLITSVGAPICDETNIRAMLDGRIAYLDFLHQAIVEELNKGSTEEEAVRHIRLPDNLAGSIFAQDMYGALDYNVRGLHQRYSGWFDQNGTHLRPVASKSRAEAFIADMGGEAAVLNRAKALHVEGRRTLALEYLDLLIAADRLVGGARQLKGAILTELGDESLHQVTRSMYHRLGKIEQEKAKNAPSP